MAKFLDADGVSFLWSQLSLQDYPNNETLVAVINAIDETKANKNDVLLKAEQELTTEEVEQVRANLKLENLATEEQVEAAVSTKASSNELYTVSGRVTVLENQREDFIEASNAEIEALFA